LKSIRRIYRFALIALLVLSGVVMVTTVLGRDPAHRSASDWRFINRWMQYLCKILGLRIHVSGQPASAPSLLAANHISWHDIIVLQSLVATGFVGKFEIRSWPLIGWLAHRGNTLFIKRGKRESFEQIHTAMIERLSANQSITLFPEGTTTTGETVKPFRSRLLEPAIKLGLAVQPVAIWYRGKMMSCRELAFTGDESFLSHITRTLGEETIDVFVHFCPAIATGANDNWRDLGRQAQLLVEEQVETMIRNNS
jgi:1-acyl-sn-glycerol-3-phosphate acyltransferase